MDFRSFIPYFHALRRAGPLKVVPDMLKFSTKIISALMATAISAWLNVFMLAGGLVHRGHYQIERAVMIRLSKYVLCSIIMGAVVWAVQIQVHPLIEGGLGAQISGLLILVFSGIGSYLIATFLTKTIKKDELRALFSKR